ncbi:MAG: xanthine dehydrogenase family protein molybdopterin-binding subunit, partial [Chitinophagaceae bacterium]|nr:xanthine dehydrogenase family protein molybdopterin-binding subunit [Chitinophagaceae bacterium]
HLNRPKLAWFDLQYIDMDAPPGIVFKPLYDEEIKFNGQPLALILANDFETARYASTLIRIKYEEELFETLLTEHLDKARTPKKGFASMLKPPPPNPTGDFEKAFNESPAKVDCAYKHNAEHHNPIELFATTTVYEEDGKLTIYDKTQGTVNVQMFVANVFGLHFRNVRVLAPFVGGGFGAGLRPQYQLFLCVMAALDMKRNVRVVLDRKQMFSFSHRPQSVQHLRFSASDDGKLTGLSHYTISETSRFEDYSESVSEWSHKLYPAANTLFDYKLVPLDVHTPLDMRAPGGATALHAIECTMDELAERLNMDPLEFRLLNYAEEDPSTGKPFTSKALRECYKLAAAKFGWSKRNPVPRSMTRGNKLVGYGMATGMWDAYQFPSRIEMILDKEGKLTVNNAVTDIGTGTLTVMTQVAADQFGLKIEDVHFGYGDSKKPFSMFQGGSAAAASTGSAIIIAANLLKKKLLKIAKTTEPFKSADVKEACVIFEDGHITLKHDTNITISLKELALANGGKSFKVTKMGMPHMMKLRKYSKATHSAVFAEVEVDKDLGTITVTRMVSAIAAGRILNPKTARSQILGSMIWGLSKVLHEESVMDEKLGKFINTNLGEYHIPVHADINKMEVIFADEKDELINELGSKGVGEIGIVGVPAAITNAIYHATGKRIRELPIHFEQLL